MKETTLFIALILVTLNFSGCNIEKFFIDQNSIGNKRQNTISNIDDMKYDQMISATFRKPFQLKFGQTAQLEGTNIKITPKNVIIDARCPINLTCEEKENSRFEAEFQMQVKDSIEIIKVSTQKATFYKDMAINIVKTTPEKHFYDGVFQEYTEENYTLTLVIQDTPFFTEEK